MQLSMLFAVPNLRHIRACRDVARYRSVSAAAKHVHLSQSAVSQAIANLEDMLGVSLFDRRPNGMIATDPGALFLARAERALDLLHQGATETLRLGGKTGEKERPADGGSQFDQLISAVQLRAIDAISDADSFSSAARAIGLSQPSIHRAARGLEQLAGIPLFQKSERGVALSRPAQILARYSGLVLAELEQAVVDVDAWRGRNVGRIVVGSLPFAHNFILPTALNHFADARPEVKVSVVDGPYNDLLGGLRNGKLDFLIGALREPNPIAGVVQERLLDAPLAVLARRGHPLTSGRRIDTNDLAAYPWVVPREGAPTRTHFDALFANAQHAPPPNIVETNSPMLIRALVVGSDRLTIASPYQFSGGGTSTDTTDQLEQLPIELANTARPIGITMRRGWHPTASQAKFLSCLRQACQQGLSR